MRRGLVRPYLPRCIHSQTPPLEVPSTAGFSGSSAALCEVQGHAGLSVHVVRRSGSRGRRSLEVRQFGGEGRGVLEGGVPDAGSRAAAELA